MCPKHEKWEVPMKKIVVVGGGVSGLTAGIYGAGPDMRSKSTKSIP
jgi:predicted NAD/FAD-binding protein